LRPLSVLYVENDQALLGLLGARLSSDERIGEIHRALDSASGLEIANTRELDVALLDFSLGAGSANGVELGRAIRRVQPNCGIVLLSQNITAEIASSAAHDFGYGWSALEKSADLNLDYLVDVLQTTARGLNVIEPHQIFESQPTVLGLSPRQHRVIELAATGLDAPEIAKQLGFAAVTVRQELSRIYKILVPNPKPGTDLRTTAVLNYLRLSRGGGEQG
jgi:DNA-binding NarL/FixJ family response regulator